jgi:hypothetical protein
MLRVTRHWGGTLKMNGAGGLRPPACALTLAVGVTPVPKPKLAHSISGTMGNATAMPYWQALCAKRPHGARSGHSLTHLGVLGRIMARHIAPPATRLSVRRILHVIIRFLARKALN